jgi:hypothetical protein
MAKAAAPFVNRVGLIGGARRLSRIALFRRSQKSGSSLSSSNVIADLNAAHAGH